MTLNFSYLTDLVTLTSPLSFALVNSLAGKDSTTQDRFFVVQKPW